ncbi:MAG: S46 family peptidase, partial [Bacteroidales bacterium]|nr:S46 family peptidase [Bacteroidales bacterium]
SIGMNRGIDNLKVVKRKKAEEKAFAAWVKKNGTAEQKAVLKELSKAIEDAEPYSKAIYYCYECLLNGPEIFRFARNMDNLATDKDKDALKEAARNFYKDYSASTDRKTTAAMLAYYASHIDKQFHPDFFKSVANEAAFQRFADELFTNSIMADSSKLLKAIDNGDFAAIKSDKATLCAKDITTTFANVARHKLGPIAERISDAERIYLAARMQMQPERDFYSDANFTMRLSYGQVGGYSTTDTTYTYFTDLEGVMAKEDPNNWEFIVDPKLKELFNNKDYGRYADNDGKMHVCFLTNNDITGGNSGSPVINGDGELIGLAFDGNWESMSGDIIFEPSVQRCICVDIRYVLFVVDRIGGAKNILDELTIAQ